MFALLFGIALIVACASVALIGVVLAIMLAVTVIVAASHRRAVRR